MNSESLYGIIRDITKSLSNTDQNFTVLPEEFNPGKSLDELNLDVTCLPEIFEELQKRFNGKELKNQQFLSAEVVNSLTIGELIEQLLASLTNSTVNPIVVYVDDEEENLFIFKRKFGKLMNLKTFTDSLVAKDFILANSDVGLVITDESMPNLSGNKLCDEVKKVKPGMKFILITGNPQGDEDLMYSALSKNRFYDFINKPVDFEKNGDKYLAMIRSILKFSV